MYINKKIKSERIKLNLTQEEMAEKLGTTRQTVSNWENNHSYPDIISLVKMSNIFEISLDDFIKDDKETIQYLDENTNLLKYKASLKKFIEISVLLIVFGLCLLSIYLNRYTQNALSETAILYYAFPVTVFTLSISIGSDKMWGKFKLNMPFVFGFVHYLVFAFNYSITASYENEVLDFILRSIHAGFPNFLLIFALSYSGLLIGYLFTKKKNS